MRNPLGCRWDSGGFHGDSGGFHGDSGGFQGDSIVVFHRDSRGIPEGFQKGIRDFIVFFRFFIVSS